MTLIFDHPELETRVRRLAKKQGETLTQAVLTAVAERETRLAKPKHSPEERAAILRGIMERARARPILDDRTPDEILGYNAFGVPE